MLAVRYSKLKNPWYSSTMRRMFANDDVETAEAVEDESLGVQDEAQDRVHKEVQTVQSIKKEVHDVKIDKVVSSLVNQIKSNSITEAQKKVIENVSDILNETYTSFPKLVDTAFTVLNAKFVNKEIDFEKYVSSLLRLSFYHREMYAKYSKGLGKALFDNPLNFVGSDKIFIFDFWGGFKTYNLKDLTEESRLRREKKRGSMIQELKKAFEGTDSKATEQEGTVSDTEPNPKPKKSCIMELNGEEVRSLKGTKQEVGAKEPSVEDNKGTIEVKEPEKEGTVEAKEPEASTEEVKETTPSKGTETEEVTESQTSLITENLDYDEVEAKLERKTEIRDNKRKQQKKVTVPKPEKKKNTTKTVKGNFFGDDFSSARDKSILFYFVGRVESTVNLLSAIECKSGTTLSIRELNQRVRRNTNYHLQFTENKVQIMDTDSISPDCRYLLLNLNLRGRLSDLPLYILFFRTSSDAKFICQGRVESLEAYKAHVLNPDKVIRVEGSSLVEEEIIKGTVEAPEEEIEESEDSTDESVSDMSSISDIDSITEEWIKSEGSDNSYSKAGTTVLEYSSYISRKPEMLKCNFTINIPFSFYRNLGCRMLDCWLSDNVYKCNIYLQILLARFESKMHLNELVEGTHYLKSSNGRNYIINSGLLDIFGNDIFISFKYMKSPKKGVQYSGLDVVTGLKMVKHLGCDLSLLDLYKLEAIRLWDKGFEIFDAKIEDFDFLSMERLLHVTHERSYRYPGAVANLPVDRLFNYIKDSVKMAVKISQIDSEYVKPIFYPCDITKLEYFIPVHIFTSLSEEPELGVIVNKDSSGVWSVMTVLPYDVLLNNHRMLTIYSSRGRCKNG